MYFLRSSFSIEKLKSKIKVTAFLMWKFNSTRTKKNYSGSLSITNCTTVIKLCTIGTRFVLDVFKRSLLSFF